MENGVSKEIYLYFKVKVVVGLGQWAVTGPVSEP
jgi:hypothetical protein